MFDRLQGQSMNIHLKLLNLHSAGKKTTKAMFVYIIKYLTLWSQLLVGEGKPVGVVCSDVSTVCAQVAKKESGTQPDQQ